MSMIKPYPHTYRASAAARAAGTVTLGSPAVPSLPTAPPPEFGGPGGLWSPETLLCASLADCFILSFRGCARAARYEWLHLDCSVDGVLDRVDGVSQFIRYTTTAKLSIPDGADRTKAYDLLERAERGCLIANSLRGTRRLVAQVVVEQGVERAVG